MVIVQLMGGLGNQLFQYAMGRNLAMKWNTVLKLDVSSYEGYEWHDYSLSPFNIDAAFATAEEVAHLVKLHGSFINRVLRKTTGKGAFAVHERSMLFDSQYLKIKPPIFLSGYWQSEKYFEQSASKIRQEFKIKIPPSEENARLLEDIKNNNSVSLHIRRGNYISVPEFNKVLGTCSLEYYDKAISYLSSRMKDPVFYIFSDDIPWARANLRSEFRMNFVEINDATHDYEDIRLMQHCRHHIIANSTFSWWGAWLNDSPQKIVIAPKQWFVEFEKNKAAETLIPAGWVKI